jgi:hypothetical protein
LYEISDSHSGIRITVFWDMTQCSVLDRHQNSGGAYCRHLQCRKMEMEPADPSEMGYVSIYQSTWWFILGDRDIQINVGKTQIRI